MYYEALNFTKAICNNFFQASSKFKVTKLFGRIRDFRSQSSLHSLFRTPCMHHIQGFGICNFLVVGVLILCWKFFIAIWILLALLFLWQQSKSGAFSCYLFAYSNKYIWSTHNTLKNSVLMILSQKIECELSPIRPHFMYWGLSFYFLPLEIWLLTTSNWCTCLDFDSD